MIDVMSRMARLLALVLAAIAAVDAARGPHWDQFAMLIAIVVLQLFDVVARRLVPPTVEVRADLLAWLRDEAARTDDSPALVVDRALASYRAVHAPPGR